MEVFLRGREPENRVLCLQKYNLIFTLLGRSTEKVKAWSWLNIFN